MRVLVELISYKVIGVGLSLIIFIVNLKFDPILNLSLPILVLVFI